MALVPSFMFHDYCLSLATVVYFSGFLWHIAFHTVATVQEERLTNEGRHNLLIFHKQACGKQLEIRQC